MASPDINAEDFQTSVDFLSVQDNIDPEKIGIIGIRGWGGMALNAQRAMDDRNGNYAPGGGVVDPLPEEAPFLVKDSYD